MSHQKEKQKIASTPGTSDIRVSQFEPVDAPDIIKAEIPISPKAAALVLEGRNEIRNAITGKDRRILVITGPCSIHDGDAALEYGTHLRALQNELHDKMLIVMRVYFEKPRTTVGWKGLINDPKLDNSGDINTGLRKAREILLQINHLGLFAATEFLDPIVPQYTADLVTWAAIGARTTESQTHREMASGLSMPVGFKNSTDGDLQTALDAMVSARHGHSFLGIDQTGRTAIVRTKGNPDVHLVLRGGNGKPNYSPAHIAYAREAIKTGSDLPRSILVDCSHGNSGKDYRKQPEVFNELVNQISGGDRSILGMMLESNLHEGNQKMAPLDKLRHGVSITDGCIDWETTEKLLREAYKKI